MIKDVNSKMKQQKRGGVPAAAAVSLLAGFTVCFFAPAETYLNNPAEYHLNAAHALLPLLLTAAAVSAGIFLLLRLLNRLHQTAAKAAECLILGFTLAGYIQMMFYNGKLGQLDGTTDILGMTTLYTYVNWFVFLLILLLPLILFAATEKKPESALGKAVRSKKTVPFLCGTLLLMQTAGFASLLPNMSIASRIENHQSYLSYAPALSLSEEENITVFLTDRMDGQWFDEVLETDPSLYDTLDGFTFYQNNVSNYTLTFPSAAFLISGIPFESNNTTDAFLPHEAVPATNTFLEQIWSDERNVMRKLHNSGWATHFLFEQGSACGPIEQIADCADNILQTEKAPEYNYLRNGNGIIPAQLKLSLFRLMPYLLKEPFDCHLTPDSFTVYDMELPDKLMQDVCPQSDLNFYHYLEHNPVHAGSSRKTASFIHLNCAHDQNAELAALCPAVAQGAADPVSTACGSFTVIRRYLEQLKAAGLYDKTTVIILGDHGRFPNEVAFQENNRLNGVITTTLLIKPANAEHGRLRTDAEAELSNRFFPASLLEYAGLPHTDYGISYQDVIAEELHPERTLYLFFSQEKLVLENAEASDPEERFRQVALGRTYYTINGNARDFSNWVFHEDRNADT